MGNDPWGAVLERLDDAAKLTGVDPDIHRLLRTPRRQVERLNALLPASGAA